MNNTRLVSKLARNLYWTFYGCFYYQPKKFMLSVWNLYNIFKNSNMLLWYTDEDRRIVISESDSRQGDTIKNSVLQVTSTSYSHDFTGDSLRLLGLLKHNTTSLRIHLGSLMTLYYELDNYRTEFTKLRNVINGAKKLQKLEILHYPLSELPNFPALTHLELHLSGRFFDFNSGKNGKSNGKTNGKNNLCNLTTLILDVVAFRKLPTEYRTQSMEGHYIEEDFNEPITVCGIDSLTNLSSLHIISRGRRLFLEDDLALTRLDNIREFNYCTDEFDIKLPVIYGLNLRKLLLSSKSKCIDVYCNRLSLRELTVYVRECKIYNCEYLKQLTAFPDTQCMSPLSNLQTLVTGCICRYRDSKIVYVTGGEDGKNIGGGNSNGKGNNKNIVYKHSQKCACEFVQIKLEDTGITKFTRQLHTSEQLTLTGDDLKREKQWYQNSRKMHEKQARWGNKDWRV